MMKWFLCVISKDHYSLIFLYETNPKMPFSILHHMIIRLVLIKNLIQLEKQLTDQKGFGNQNLQSTNLFYMSRYILNYNFSKHIIVLIII